MVRELMIAGFIPPFAEREVLWFEENAKKIKDLAQHDSFWKENTAFIEESAHLSLSEFMRKLDDLRYEKVQTVAAHGEFAVLGGIVTVFPINLNHPIRIEFLGNKIEKIYELPPQPTTLPQEKRERLLRKEMLKREISHLHNLKAGDYLVHLDHGIGVFKEIIYGYPTSIDSEKAYKKYYVLEYAPPKNGNPRTERAEQSSYDGKQVAVLCPTTILADQHYETFSARFSRFPVNISILSRFESKKAQKETVKKLKEGKIDIIIGTHRLLSSDVEFKNLGLLIIDEEQRFGVKQKEKLKKMRETIDVLSLSATPIPRTLYLALSGLRRISVINTPPFGRIPIETFVLPYDKETIRKAIREELHRRGQTYFLHNKIETIEKVKEMLKELVPEARFETIHGRTPEARLRAAMQNFKQKQCDVLVSTTIIENGLDIKNANTLIVDDATRLGLAQAYQIRGRIGRAEKKARAYFLYPVRGRPAESTASIASGRLTSNEVNSHKILSEDAQKRLEALEKATKLGSGYFIAQKDLEIRGAGNILGKAQSGAINAVGLNLYCQILNEAVERLNANTVNPALESACMSHK